MEREHAEEIVFEYVSRHKDKSIDHSGVHVIPYGDNVFVAIETRKNHKGRYLGWFTVQNKKEDMLGWKFESKFLGSFIYQNETDYLEE